MKQLKIFLASVALSLFALFPAAAMAADADELDVTMEVMDSIDGSAIVMQGPEHDGPEGSDDEGDGEGDEHEGGEHDERGDDVPNDEGESDDEADHDSDEEESDEDMNDDDDHIRKLVLNFIK